jgi:hypothetical protein
MIRSGDGSITWRRNPWKMPGPALPASTNVVVPLHRATSLGVDAERGPAPVDMGVEVDQPRHDEQPAHIDGLGAADREFAPEPGYLAVAESDIGGLVAPARRVDDAAASEDHIRHPLPLTSSLAQNHDTRVRGRRRERCGCGPPYRVPAPARRACFCRESTGVNFSPEVFMPADLCD